MPLWGKHLIIIDTTSSSRSMSCIYFKNQTCTHWITGHSTTPYYCAICCLYGVSPFHYHTCQLFMLLSNGGAQSVNLYVHPSVCWQHVFNVTLRQWMGVSSPAFGFMLPRGVVFHLAFKLDLDLHLTLILPNFWALAGRTLLMQLLSHGWVYTL